MYSFIVHVSRRTCFFLHPLYAARWEVNLCSILCCFFLSFFFLVGELLSLSPLLTPSKLAASSGSHLGKSRLLLFLSVQAAAKGRRDSLSKCWEQASMMKNLHSQQIIPYKSLMCVSVSKSVQRFPKIASEGIFAPENTHIHELCRFCHFVSCHEFEKIKQGITVLNISTSKSVIF